MEQAIALYNKSAKEINENLIPLNHSGVNFPFII